MIIARSPLRISLGGGGTDLESYYKYHEGFLVAAAIDKYVYASISRPFTEGVYLKYSSQEQVRSVDEIRHPIIRESLKLLKLKTPQVEITTLADIPSGTGLGSSGSFTTALLKGLYTHYRKSIQSADLAELACRVEIDLLNEPIGKQDQYISAIGGLTEFTFRKDGHVEFAPLNIANENLRKLEDNLILFFTGVSRSASSILRDQRDQSIAGSTKMIENLHRTKELGIRSRNALVSGALDEFAHLMHEHWMAKRNRSSGMTNSEIDEVYDGAIHNGALGGKLVGAGGGGFLMFYAQNPERVRNYMKNKGLEEVRFRFDFEGTKVVLS